MRPHPGHASPHLLGVGGLLLPLLPSWVASVLVPWSCPLPGRTGCRWLSVVGLPCSCPWCCGSLVGLLPLGGDGLSGQGFDACLCWGVHFGPVLTGSLFGCLSGPSPVGPVRLVPVSGGVLMFYPSCFWLLRFLIAFLLVPVPLRLVSGGPPAVRVGGVYLGRGLPLGVFWVFLGPC